MTDWNPCKLVDGRAVLINFQEEGHTYTILASATARPRGWNADPSEETVVPSVTQILRCAGMSADYTNVPEHVLEHKRVIGSYLHKAAHYAAAGDLDLDSLHEQVRPYFMGYQAFLADSGFEITNTERRVVGCWNGFWWAGTLDIEGEWQGEPWILDLKTTAQLYPAHEIQTAGYDLCLPKPMRPPFAYKRGTLHLKPDGTYARPKAHTNPRDRDDFLLALQLWWAKKARGIKQHGDA
jgi:hypothetical protein